MKFTIVQSSTASQSTELSSGQQENELTQKALKALNERIKMVFLIVH